MSVFDNISFEYGGNAPEDKMVPIGPGEDTAVDELRNVRYEKDGAYLMLTIRGGTKKLRNFGSPIRVMYHVKLGRVDAVKDYFCIQTDQEVLLYDYKQDRRYDIETVVLSGRIDALPVGKFLYIFSPEDDYARMWSHELGLQNYNNYLPSGITSVSAINRTDVPDQDETIWGYKQGAAILVYDFGKGEFVSTKISRMDGSQIFYVNADDVETEASFVFPFEERYSDLLGTNLSPTDDARARGSIRIFPDSNTGSATGGVSVTIGTDTSAGTATVTPSDTHTEIGDAIAALINNDATLSNKWTATAKPETYWVGFPFATAYVRTKVEVVSKSTLAAGDAISLTLDAGVDFEWFGIETQAYNIYLSENSVYGSNLSRNMGFVLSRGYALVDELSDGSLSFVGRPSIISYGAENISIAGNKLTFKAAPKFVRKRYLLSTLWRAGSSNTLTPSTPNFSNSPYYINSVIDVDATSHDDFKSDEQLITPVEGFLPLSGGVATQFGPGEIMPETTALIENTMVFGGYRVNRPVPAIYTQPATPVDEPDTVTTGYKAIVRISLTNWTVYQGTHVGLILNGTTYSLGGWDTSVSDGSTIGGSAAAEYMADMLNGEVITEATGYSSLPPNLTATKQGGDLIIERTDLNNDLITVGFDAQWESDVTAVLSEHGEGSLTERPGNSALYTEGDELTDLRAGIRFEYTDGRRSNLITSGQRLRSDLNLMKIHSLNTLVKAIDVCVVDDTQPEKGDLPAAVDIEFYEWHRYQGKSVSMIVAGITYNVGWSGPLPLSGDKVSGTAAVGYIADVLNDVNTGLGGATGDSFPPNTFIAIANGNVLRIQRVPTGRNPFTVSFGPEWQEDVDSSISGEEPGKQGVKPSYLWKRINITDGEAHGLQFFIPTTTSGLEEITGYDQYSDDTVSLSNYITIAVPGQSVFIDKQQPVATSSPITKIIPFSFNVQSSVIRFKMFVFTTDEIQQGVIEDLGTAFRGYFDIVDAGTVNESPDATMYLNGVVLFKSVKGLHVLSDNGVDMLLRKEAFSELEQPLSSIGYFEDKDEVWYMFEGGGALVWQRQYKSWFLADFPSYSTVTGVSGQQGQLLGSVNGSVVEFDNKQQITDESVNFNETEDIAGSVLLLPIGDRRKGIYLLDTTVYGAGGTIDMHLDEQHDLLEPGTGWVAAFDGDEVIAGLTLAMSGVSIGLYRRCVQPRIQITLKPTSTNAFIESIRQRFNEYQLTGNARRTLWD